MTEPEPLRGHCLCGAVTMTVTPPAPEIDVCHCDMCRRWGGGALLTTRLVTDPQFTGEEQIGRYASSEWAERGFCKTCGTHLFYRYVPKDGYSFPIGLFDAVPGYAMVEQIFIDEKPDYYSFAQHTETLTGAEVFAKFSPGGEG